MLHFSQSRCRELFCPLLSSPMVNINIDLNETASQDRKICSHLFSVKHDYLNSEVISYKIT